MLDLTGNESHQQLDSTDLSAVTRTADVRYLRLLQRNEQGQNVLHLESASRVPGEATGLPEMPIPPQEGVYEVLTSEAVSEAKIVTPEIHPAVKKRRTSSSSQGPPSHVPTAALLSAFSRVVDEVGKAAEAAEHEGHCFHLSQHLQGLLELVTKLGSRNSLHLVPESELCSMLGLLERPLQHGLHFLDLDAQVDSAPVQDAITALQAAHIALLTLTSSGIPKTALKEELVEKIVEVISFHVQQTVLPAYDPTARKDKAEADEEKPMSRSASKRLKARGYGDSVSQVTVKILDMLCTLLPQLACLVSATKLQDSTISLLSRTALSTFPVTNIVILQLKALSVLAAIFESSAQHHTPIMDDIVQMLWKVPLGKRQNKGYHLKDNVTQIHIMSALVLLAVQCSIKAPTLTAPQADAPVQRTDNPGDEAVALEKGLDQAVDLARYFWRAVLERWLAMKVTADANEARAAVEEMVEDFLVVSSSPEFPAASVLLQTLSHNLDKESGLKSENAAVRGVAIDLLGLIATRLKQDDLSSRSMKRDLLLLGIGEEDFQGSQLGTGCYICSTTPNTSALLACTVCSRSSCHCSCLGVDDQQSVSFAWVCHTCTALRNLTQAASDGLKPERALVLQQLIVDYLRTGSTMATTSAVRFISALWLKDSRAFPDVANVCKGWAGQVHAIEGQHPLPKHLVLSVSRALDAGRPLARSFDALVSRLLASLHDKPVNRAKAMKAVSAIVEADPSELAKDHVRRDVEQRFLDSSISVREAAIDLVGKHIVQQPEVAAKYYDVICDRIKDKGVSVRKRAIKIIRGLCLQHPTFEHAVDACAKIFSRFNDEESSIRDLVMKTLRELWFQTSEDSPQNVEEQVSKATSQMVEVMKQPRSHQALVTIIRQSMFDEVEMKAGTEVTEGGASRGKDKGGCIVQPDAKVRLRCELMCKSLLESILQVQERGAADCESLPYLVALQAFCDVDATLCVPPKDPARYATTLLPYLLSQAERLGKRSNGDINIDQATEARLCETIILILASLLPHIRRPPPSFVEGLQKSLSKCIVQHEYMTVVQASVRCLCNLQDTSRQSLQPFLDLVGRFFLSLTKPNAPKAFAPRCLYVLGLFCRYGAKHLIGSEERDVSVSKITTTFKQLLQSGEPIIKLKALQALGLVCVAVPEEMESEEVVAAYTHYLRTDAQAAPKVQVLKNLCEFALVSEEKPKAQREGAGGPTIHVAVAAGAGDTVTASGPIQRHWDAVLDCLLSQDTDVQQNALKLVEVALGQGIVFPVTCVSHLIALAADEVETTRHTAQRLLSLINSRWGGYKFIENKFAEGFRFAYSGLQNRLPNDDCARRFPGTPGHIKDGLGHVYALVRPTGTAKQNVLNPIMKRFDHVDSGGNLDLTYLLFCTEVLAALPFAMQDEVLYVVTEASKIIHRRGGALQSTLKSILTDEGPLAAQAQAAYQQLLAERKKGTRADSGRNSGSGIVHHLASDSKEPAGNPEILKQAQESAEAAAAINLLLLLKSWLKSAYNLSDAKCLAFGHAESTKSQDNAIRKEVKELDLEGVASQHQDDICHYVRQFLLLKNLMKEDSGDYTGLLSSSPKTQRRRASLPVSATIDTEGQDPDMPMLQAPPVAQSAPPKRSQMRRRALEVGPVPFTSLDQPQSSEGSQSLSGASPQVKKRRSSGKSLPEIIEG